MNVEIGLSYYNNNTISVSLLYHEKSGYQSQNYSTYPNANISTGESIDRSTNDQYALIEASTYRQINLRIQHRLRLYSSFFIVTGLEYIEMNFDFGDGNDPLRQTWRKESSYNTIGILGGLGIELPIAQKTSIVGQLVYSFAKQKGEFLGYANSEFDLGGIEFTYTLRQYLF